MSAALCSLLLVGFRSCWEPTILRICEIISVLAGLVSLGPEAAAVCLPPELPSPFFEVLASDCRKRPPILRDVRECLLFQVDDTGAHFVSPV